MLVSSRTTTALLKALLDPQAEEAWTEFVDRFRPIIRGFARGLGVGQEDAEDIAQETLVRFLKYYRQGKFDRDRGRLSSWIMTIARNCAHDWWQKTAARRENRGESAFVDLSDPDELNRIWDGEFRRVLLERALEELRSTTRLDPRTIRAFELIAFEEKDAAEVAAQLNVSVDSVYAAKHRCLNQLHEIMTRLTQVYEDP